MHFNNTRRLLPSIMIAAAALALALALASGAQAANYYNIVNTDTGKALEATTTGVRIVPLKRTNPLQQWKRIHPKPFSSFFDSAVQNRLLGCLRTNTTTFGNIIAPLGIGSCAGADTDPRKRWYHLAGNDTESPAVPGYQLVNLQTVEYVADFRLCFSNPCPQTYGASLLEATGFDGQHPGVVKWRYRFAESATP